MIRNRNVKENLKINFHTTHSVHVDLTCLAGLPLSINVLLTEDE